MGPTDAGAEETWRSFFREAAADDVRSFVEDYPAERSLYVDVVDLHRYDEDLVDRLFADPDGVLRRGVATLRSVHDDLDRVNLRLRNLPSQLNLGSVRVRHRSKLVSVDGRVDAVGPVEARATTAVLVCPACGAERRERPLGIERPGPDACSDCGAAVAASLDRERSTFVDVQRVVLAAADGADGTMPVYLDDDLVGTVAAEDRRRITGIVRLDRRADGNRFGFYLDGLTVEAGTRAEPDADRDVDDRVKEAIRSRWEFVVGG